MQCDSAGGPPGDSYETGFGATGDEPAVGSGVSEPMQPEALDAGAPRACVQSAAESFAAELPTAGRAGDPGWWQGRGESERYLLRPVNAMSRSFRAASEAGQPPAPEIV